MKIGIATDHNGVEEKEKLIYILESLNYDIEDLSQENDSNDDYPDFAFNLAEKVASKELDLGILMCGTGIGMSIAANKVKGVRCAKVSNVLEASLAKQHNNANVIALSYKIPIEELKDIVISFIETNFSNEERHSRRIDKIERYENNEY